MRAAFYCVDYDGFGLRDECEMVHRARSWGVVPYHRYQSSSGGSLYSETIFKTDFEGGISWFAPGGTWTRNAGGCHIYFILTHCSRKPHISVWKTLAPHSHLAPAWNEYLCQQATQFIYRLKRFGKLFACACKISATCSGSLFWNFERSDNSYVAADSWHSR